MKTSTSFCMYLCIMHILICLKTVQLFGGEVIGASIFQAPTITKPILI